MHGTTSNVIVDVARGRSRVVPGRPGSFSALTTNMKLIYSHGDGSLEFIPAEALLALQGFDPRKTVYANLSYAAMNRLYNWPNYP